MTHYLEVEVVYALPDRQVMKRLQVTKGTTAENAIVQSGILEIFPEIDLARNHYGIFGKLIKKETVLHHRDRVEIYRPLIIDPKDARRRRATIS